MDFCMVENGVLTFDFALRKKSIGEAFESHAGLNALNPIWRPGDPMAECTALPTFLLMLLAWHAAKTLAEDSRVHSGALLAVFLNHACLVNTACCGAGKSFSCLPLVLTLLTASQLPSELFWIRACNNGVLTRRLGCSLNFG